MNQQQTEQLRWAVLEYLAYRAVCAFSAFQVVRGLNAGGVNHMIGAALDEPSVKQALAFLEDEFLAKSQPEPMGATRAFQVTSKGTLAWERRRLEQEG